MKNRSFFVPQYVDIKGGNPLKKGATVTISGAKNEVLGSMAAAILTTEPVVLKNVPYIQDVLDMGRAMMELGVDLKYNPEQKMMWIQAKNKMSNVLSPETTKFRASYYLWGAMIARFSITKESDTIESLFPGGDNFSGRGFDYHLNLFSAIHGVEGRQNKEKIKFILPEKPKQEDAFFETLKQSHGATFNYLLSTATSQKTNYMYNAALEPEVASLVKMLNKMGARIRGQRATAIISNPHDGLLQGCTHDVMPDRMETGFYALLAAALDGKIKIKGIDWESCEPWVNLLRETSQVNPKFFHLNRLLKSKTMRFDFKNVLWENRPGRQMIVSPFPGKETDMEQVWIPVFSKLGGQSTIIDPIWTGRLGDENDLRAHPNEALKFGLNMAYDKNYMNRALRIDITPSQLKPASQGAYAANLRSAAEFMMMALMVPGFSRIYRPGFATRGFPNLIQNLRNMGLDLSESTQGSKLDSLPYWDLSKER